MIQDHSLDLDLTLIARRPWWLIIIDQYWSSGYLQPASRHLTAQQSSLAPVSPEKSATNNWSPAGDAGTCTRCDGHRLWWFRRISQALGISCSDGADGGKMPRAYQGCNRLQSELNQLMWVWTWNTETGVEPLNFPFIQSCEWNCLALPNLWKRFSHRTDLREARQCH